MSEVAQYDHGKHGQECCPLGEHHELQVSGVEVWYGPVRALHHVNFHIGCGHCVGILGPNGAGKSTLLKAIAGLVPLRGGSIQLHGRRPAEMARDISYLPQRKRVDWSFPVTVRGLVEMGRYPHLGFWRRFRDNDQETVERALERLGLVDLADRQISELSGGQQQRTFLARAWAQEAHVYLLDEPFEGLDTNAQADLQKQLSSLAAEGRLVLASHHNLANVPDLFDHILFLRGEQIDFGLTGDTFTAENRDATFAPTALESAA